MKLIDFHRTEPIFIDANIFTYFALRNPTFQANCTTFLERIEREEIHAVTSTFVLNEAYYALLIGKGSELLNSTKLKRIKKSLVSNGSIASQCYDVCQEFDHFAPLHLARNHPERSTEHSTELTPKARRNQAQADSCSCQKGDVICVPIPSLLRNTPNGKMP